MKQRPPADEDRPARLGEQVGWFDLYISSENVWHATLRFGAPHKRGAVDVDGHRFELNAVSMAFSTAWREPLAVGVERLRRSLAPEIELQVRSGDDRRKAASGSLHRSRS